MNRSFALLMGAVVVLGLLVLLFANPFRSDSGGPAEGSGLLFDAKGISQADRIEVTPPEAAPSVLERSGTVWTVSSQGNFPADTASVNTILRSIGEASSSSVASRNPENRYKFGVDQTGVAVKVSSAGRELAHLWIGKPGRDFTTSYVRLEGKDDVHIVRGINRNLFTRPQGFRDRTLFQFDVASVESVTLTAKEGGWAVARSDSAWTVAKPGELPVPAQKDAVDQILRTLSALSADGFEDRPDTVRTGLEDPDRRLTVRLRTGEDREVLLGAKNSQNQHYARRLDREAVYLLGEWRVNNVAKPFEDLADLP